MTSKDKTFDKTLIILDGLLIIALLIMPLSWFFDPFRIQAGPLSLSVSWGARPLLAPVILLVIRMIRKHFASNGRGLADLLIFKQGCMALLVPFFMIAILNQIAAWSGIEAAPDSPIVITGQEHIDTVVEDNRVVRDPELLFAFNPNITWDGFPINEHGFRTRDFEPTKPANTIRVMALGDSCTAQGRPPYSDRLHELLQENAPNPDANWEAFNTGVYGYSLMQGYRQFLRYGPKFDPDIVTIYFGWNDHWLYDRPDHKRMAVRMNRIQASLIMNLREKPLFAWLSRQANRARAHQVKTGDDNRTFRVPPEFYTMTLKDLINAIREMDAKPIIITAARRNLHPVLVKTGHARSPEEAEVAHDHYVELTRAVARETATPLLDLANEFAAPEYDHLFMDDGIHFNTEGLDEIAKRLHQKLLSLGESGYFD